jgi:hypothetical protein
MLRPHPSSYSSGSPTMSRAVTDSIRVLPIATGCGQRISDGSRAASRVQRASGGEDAMREIAYDVRGFLTVRRDSLRVPLSGSLAVHADADSSRFTGDLVLHQATISRTVLGVSLFSATVQIEAGSPVVGGIDHESRMVATVTVDAVIADVHAAGRTLISGSRCRTATHAVVPLRSKPGFSLERGGRVVGKYRRPPFTGCGWITPLVNLLVAGPGNAVIMDLIPLST